jgi:YD repeat-containing protein
VKARQGAALFRLLVLAVAAGPLAHAEEEDYRSNAIGMRLGAATEASGYVLRVRSADGTEEDRLFDEGREVRRTVRVRNPADGTVSETVSEQGTVTATRTYDASGRLAEEKTAQGVRILRYRGEALESLEVSDADGKPLYRERYAYTSRGRLREAERVYADGSRSISSFLFSDGRLVSERLAADERVLTARFDASGRLVAESEQQGGEVVWERTLRYDAASGELAQTLERRKDHTLRGLYDAAGRIVQEERTGSGSYRSFYTYDAGGRQVRLRRIGGLGTEEWQTTYDDKGNASRESYLVRGLLQRVRVHTGERAWYDDLYHDGKPVLRVTYRNDEKVGEERLE